MAYGRQSGEYLQLHSTAETMRRSIVPPGFEASSHRIFHDYLNPLSLPITFGDQECNSTERTTPTLPVTKKFEGGNSEVDDPLCCPICLQSTSDPVTLVACHHFFCMECIIKWFQAKLECPLCKVSCAFFIQPFPGVEEQYNLWKTAPTAIGCNEMQGSLNFSSSVSTGLRRAMEAHRSNFCSRKYHIPYCANENAADVSSITHDSRTHYTESIDTRSISLSMTTTCKTMVDDAFSTVDVHRIYAANEYLVLQSSDLGIISDELRRLEEELKSEYGADSG